MLKQILYFRERYRKQIRSAVLSMAITLITSLAVIGAITFISNFLSEGPTIQVVIVTIILVGSVTYMGLFVLDRR